MDGAEPLLLTGPSVTLVTKPHPLRSESLCAEVQAGQTLAQMLGESASHALEVRVGGELVPRVLWARVKPKAGQFVHVQMYPQGGGGGKFLRTVLLVVVAIAAIWITGGAAAGLLGSGFAAGTTGAALLGAAVGIVGALAINALIPPPVPKGLGGAAGDPFQQLQSITGTSNQANPYGVIPCVVGTMRFFPPHAALPYTEISGDDQYLRMLLDLGYGDLDISDIQIGGTDIASYQDVEYEIGANPGLFTQDVYELAIGVDMSTDAATATRTTQSASNEVSLDLVFNNGLFGVDTSGKTTQGTVTFTIQYSPAGANIWTSVTGATGLTSTNGLVASGSNFTVSSSARKTLRCGVRWKVTPGQYDVMVTRVSSSFPGSAGASAQSGGCAWSVLRSVAYHNPSTTGTTKLAVRIKATGQLNGVVQNLSVLAAQKIPTWDKAGQAWTVDAETQNPAWIYAWLLTRCPAVQRRLPDARLDLDGIADWAAECTAKGLVCSFMMDSARALFDVIRDVLAAGRASFGMRNALYSAVRDVAQTVPVQIFTPANSWGFNYTRMFSELPHALRVKFTNPEANYQQDEVIVYWDGYSADGAGGTTVATRFEQLDLGMVPDPNAAWRLGRYHLAVAYNRPNTYTFNADIENIVCERGDLVYGAHDITHWGADWGRITAVSSDGKTVTLDGPVTLDAGVTYNFRVRRADGSQTTDTVTSAPATEAITATAESFFMGDGITKTAQLSYQNKPVTNPTVTAMHQTDWQGRLALSATPRTNYQIENETTAGWGYLNTTIGLDAIDGPDGAPVVYAKEDTTTGAHQFNSPWCSAPAFAANGYLTFVCDFALSAGYKNGENQLIVYVASTNNAMGTNSAYIDLATQTVVSTQGMSAQFVRILPNGFMRFQFIVGPASLALPAGGTFALVIVYANGATFTGDGVTKVYARVDCYDGQVTQVGPYISSGSNTTPVTVTDYAVDSSGDVTLGQSPAVDATLDWDGTGDTTVPMDTLTLGAALASTDVGNLFVLGDVTRDVAPLIVKLIDPGADLSAQLTLVDAAPAVLNADSGTPPPFVSSITGQSWCAAPDPPQLNLIVTGAPNDSGAFNQGGGISIPPQPGILRGGSGGGYLRNRIAIR